MTDKPITTSAITKCLKRINLKLIDRKLAFAQQSSVEYGFSVLIDRVVEARKEIIVQLRKLKQ